MQYSDFFTSAGRINSVKTRESWIQTHNPEFFESVSQFIDSSGITADRFVEKLWYYFNDTKKTVTCKNPECANRTGFKSLGSGFLEYCSSKCSNSSALVKKTKAEACIKKYGVENPYRSAKVIEKIKQTNLMRHGVENPMQSKEIKERMIANSIEKNGTPWSLSKGGIADLTRRENSRRQFEEKYLELTLLAYSDEKFGTCTFFDNKCNHTFSINKWQAHQRKKYQLDLCTLCNPIGSYNDSVWQSEIAEVLTSLGVKFKEKDRNMLSGLELDFYIESHKIAIELNGLYWHSIEFKNPNYHLNKTELCESFGIKLIHIFEDEWKYKKEIVVSRLKNALGLSQCRIYARKCKVREISGKEALVFIEENHIQGNIPAAKRLGLFHEDIMVSVMTFGALRRALGSKPKDRVYEMYRFCNKLNTTVIGGASKLLNHFIKSEDPSYIVSYADRRWSNGNLYRKLGFSLIEKTKPNYWIVDQDRRMHRFGYTKKKLTKKISADLTTDEMMSELKLLRIFDSGNFKFRLDIH